MMTMTTLMTDALSLRLNDRREIRTQRSVAWDSV